jgi:hypothetical protein
MNYKKCISIFYWIHSGSSRKQTKWIGRLKTPAPFLRFSANHEVVFQKVPNPNKATLGSKITSLRKNKNERLFTIFYRPNHNSIQTYYTISSPTESLVDRIISNILGVE